MIDLRSFKTYKNKKHLKNILKIANIYNEDFIENGMYVSIDPDFTENELIIKIYVDVNNDRLNSKYYTLDNIEKYESKIHNKIIAYADKINNKYSKAYYDNTLKELDEKIIKINKQIRLYKNEIKEIEELNTNKRTSWKKIENLKNKIKFLTNRKVSIMNKQAELKYEENNKSELLKEFSNAINNYIKISKKVEDMIKTSADWLFVPDNKQSYVEIITNAMQNQEKVKILYNDGKWRIISPISWKTSNDGNVLVVAYNESGEVRTYRLDRIEKVQYQYETQDSGKYKNTFEDVNDKYDYLQDEYDKMYY